MKKLINAVLNEYRAALQLDVENTDALFFICEEIGSDLPEATFNKFCLAVEKECEKLGL